MKKILFAIVSIFALAACVKEELPQSQQQIADGDKVTLTFGVKVPEAGSATRAMGDDNEEISRLDVIVFDNAGYFVDAVQATAVATDDVPYDSETKTFKVSLNSASRERRIHFVANADPAQIAAIKGHEDAAISSLVVSGTTDAYWQRMVYGGIGVDSDDFTAPADFFGKDTRVIPLVRNYAKITVTDSNATDAFELTGYKVFNTRSQGSVAAYDEKVGQFVDFSKAPAEGSGKLFAAKNYSELSNYTPLEKGELTSSAAYTPDPTYVRETSKNSPYIIIKGNYTENGQTTECYYKLDFILDGVGGKANILRNFQYNFVINAVTKKGTDEETAKNQTSGENGLSFDAGTQSLLNISDGVGQLFVNATTVVLVDGKPYDLKYKYIPAITSPNTTGNNQVTLTGFSGGKVINTYTPTTTEGIATVDGWSTITITPNALPTAGFETQEVVLSTPSGLARTVKFILMQPYAMTVNAYDGVEKDEEVDAALNEDVWVDVAIPNNVDASLFPLEFVFETEKNSLSPNASANTMPVRTGESIIPGSDAEANTFGFVYTLTKSAYDTCTTDANGNKVFTAKFKTSKAANATKVYVYNPYFALGNDRFRNPSANYTYDIEAVLGANAAVYGAGQEVTLDITLPEAPAGVNVSVETTGFSSMQTRATGTYTTNENGQVQLKMTTEAWAGTRSVTVSCASQQPIDNGWDNITYNAKTVSVTPNKLYIPEGSLKATTPVSTGAVSVKVGSTTASETITFKADGTNNAATVTLAGLSENSAATMTLSYTNNGATSTATTTVGAAMSKETNDIRFITRKDNQITVALNGNAKSYYGEGHNVTATITIPDASTLTLSVDQIVSNYVTLTGFEYITDNGYTSTTNTSGSLVITLNLTTSNWSGTNYTRSVNVAALPSVTNETEEITWTEGEGDGSATVNTLYIPAGNIIWESVGSNSYNISLFRTGSNSAIKSNIARGGSAGSNSSAITIEKQANLSETEKLYLVYTGRKSSDNRYTTANSAITAKQAVEGTGSTMKWTSNNTKPSY